MAWTQSDLDALDSALKRGVKRVRYSSGETEYHSLDEMLRLRAVMKAEVEDDGAGSVIAAGRLEC
ncbi:MAG: phage head-tail joining protein [Pseudolabrys sp.]